MKRRPAWLWPFLVADAILTLGLVAGAVAWHVAHRAGAEAVKVLRSPPPMSGVELPARLGLQAQPVLLGTGPLALPAWAVSGPAKARPVILVPGWGDEPWHLMAPYLRWLAKSHPVWVVHLPGQQGGPGGWVTMGPAEGQALAGACRALAKAQGQPVALYGLSMGGSAAIAAGAQAPEAVAALVTDGAFLRPSHALAPSLAVAMEAWAPLASWAAHEAEGQLALQMEEVAWAQGLAEAAAPAWAGRPWLLIHGGEDHVVPVADAERLSKLGGGTLWTIRKADHCSEPWRSPLALRQGRYQQAVLRGLAGLPPQ